MLLVNLLPKRCSTCGGIGPFHKNRAMRDGLANVCVGCSREYGQAYYAANAAHVKARTAISRKRAPEDVRARQRAYANAWAARNAAHIRAKRRRQRYGLSREDFDRMMAEQRGLCAACGDPMSEEHGQANGGVQVDHDHATGRVRALLCPSCNKGIAHFREDLARLEKAIAYLQKHKGQP